MTALPLAGVTIDCRDPATLARFWQSALGYDCREHPQHVPWSTLTRPEGEAGLNHLHLQPVPEEKVSKNRLHLDLFVDDVETEVARLVDLGATVARDTPEDSLYAQRNVVLLDPELNEFCVVQRNPRL